MRKGAKPPPPDWISPGEAVRLVGVCLSTLKKRAADWGIRVRFLPGVNRRRFNRADVPGRKPK